MSQTECPACGKPRDPMGFFMCGCGFTARHAAKQSSLESQESYWRSELTLARIQRADAEARVDYTLKRLQTVKRQQHEATKVNVNG